MPIPETTQSAILSAAEHVYATLSEQGYNPDQVHKLQVCYKAADLMVEHLVGVGYEPEHEIRTSPAVAEHSLVALQDHAGNEIVADPTWQQFLPKDRTVPAAPKVLMGTRREVAAQARSWGVDTAAADLWEKGTKINLADQRQADSDAAAQAAQAEVDGLWEKFMAG